MTGGWCLCETASRECTTKLVLQNQLQSVAVGIEAIIPKQLAPCARVGRSFAGADGDHTQGQLDP